MVSGGTRLSARASWSSKPMIDRSSGTDAPSRAAASRAPAATLSHTANSAVGRREGGTSRTRIAAAWPSWIDQPRPACRASTPASAAAVRNARQRMGPDTLPESASGSSGEWWPPSMATRRCPRSARWRRAAAAPPASSGLTEGRSGPRVTQLASTRGTREAGGSFSRVKPMVA